MLAKRRKVLIYTMVDGTQVVRPAVGSTPWRYGTRVDPQMDLLEYRACRIVLRAGQCEIVLKNRYGWRA
jgi:hypothetical protein